MISYSSDHDSRVYRYTQSLIERNDIVDVICLRSKGQPRCDTMDGASIYRIQTRKFNETSSASYLKRLIIFFFLSAIECTRLHFKRRYDLIHFHNIPDFGVFCTLIPKLMGAKIILDIHDVVPEFYMRKFSVSENHYVIRLLKVIEKISARYADHVITVTDIWHKTLIDRSVPSSKCTVILNAPYQKLFKKILKEKSKYFKLSYHGNLAEQSGVDIVIRAIGIIKKAIPSIRFQIIGHDRELKKLQYLTKKLGLVRQIQFLKSVHIKIIPDLMNEVDIGIDPKRDGVYAGETLSVKAMEYLSMGIPLIVSRTKAAQMYFNDSMVMFFEPENENDLAKCILKLYKSPEKRKEMIKQAEQFNFEHNWEKYKQIYFSLIDHLCLKNLCTDQICLP